MAASPAGANKLELRVGRVLRAHGVKGALRIESLTDFPDRFAPGRRLQLGGRQLTVAAVEKGYPDVVVRFEEITDRAAAELVIGEYVTVPLSEARPLPEDRFYHFELVGLSVVDVSSGRLLGRVAEVLPYAANDVLRVVGGEEEVLVPMVRAVVRAILRDSGRIMVDLPPAFEA